ncbi:MAG: MarR family transcriptional regulator [Candidatus Accumulibacter sp.]|jgi:DNA-binding MarR family transcriptional regulator|nr:MarR family transcriptional regulator [Accumulibacter sp.]
MPEPRESKTCSNEQLLHLFRRAAKWMARGYAPDPAHGRFHHDRARHAQGHVLSILDASGHISQRELLERLHVRSASLSELLSKLEKNGDIVRRRSEKDKRNFILHLLEQGRMKVAEHHRHRQQSAERLFSVLDDAERESLARLLSRLLDAWEAGNRG